MSASSSTSPSVPSTPLSSSSHAPHASSAAQHQQQQTAHTKPLTRKEKQMLEERQKQQEIEEYNQMKSYNEMLKSLLNKEIVLREKAECALSCHLAESAANEQSTHDMLRASLTQEYALRETQLRAKLEAEWTNKMETLVSERVASLRAADAHKYNSIAELQVKLNQEFEDKYAMQLSKLTRDKKELQASLLALQNKYDLVHREELTFQSQLEQQNSTIVALEHRIKILERSINTLSKYRALTRLMACKLFVNHVRIKRSTRLTYESLVKLFAKLQQYYNPSCDIILPQHELETWLLKVKALLKKPLLSTQLLTPGSIPYNELNTDHVYSFKNMLLSLGEVELILRGCLQECIVRVEENRNANNDFFARNQQLKLRDIEQETMLRDKEREFHQLQKKYQHTLYKLKNIEDERQAIQEINAQAPNSKHAAKHSAKPSISSQVTKRLSSASHSTRSSLTFPLRTMKEFTQHSNQQLQDEHEHDQSEHDENQEDKQLVLHQHQHTSSSLSSSPFITVKSRYAAQAGAKTFFDYHHTLMKTCLDQQMNIQYLKNENDKLKAKCAQLKRAYSNAREQKEWYWENGSKLEDEMKIQEEREKEREQHQDEAEDDNERHDEVDGASNVQTITIDDVRPSTSSSQPPLTPLPPSRPSTSPTANAHRPAQLTLEDSLTRPLIRPLIPFSPPVYPISPYSPSMAPASGRPYSQPASYTEQSHPFSHLKPQPPPSSSSDKRKKPHDDEQRAQSAAAPLMSISQRPSSRPRTSGSPFPSHTPTLFPASTNTHHPSTRKVEAVYRNPQNTSNNPNSSRPKSSGSFSTTSPSHIDHPPPTSSSYSVPRSSANKEPPYFSPLSNKITGDSRYDIISPYVAQELPWEKAKGRKKAEKEKYKQKEKEKEKEKEREKEREREKGKPREKDRETVYDSSKDSGNHSQSTVAASNDAINSDDDQADPAPPVRTASASTRPQSHVKNDDESDRVATSSAASNTTSSASHSNHASRPQSSTKASPRPTSSVPPSSTTSTTAQSSRPPSSKAPPVAARPPSATTRQSATSTRPSSSSSRTHAASRSRSPHDPASPSSRSSSKHHSRSGSNEHTTPAHTTSRPVSSKKSQLKQHDEEEEEEEQEEEEQQQREQQQSNEEQEIELDDNEPNTLPATNKDNQISAQPSEVVSPRTLRQKQLNNTFTTPKKSPIAPPTISSSSSSSSQSNSPALRPSAPSPPSQPDSPVVVRSSTGTTTTTISNNNNNNNSSSSASVRAPRSNIAHSSHVAASRTPSQHPHRGGATSHVRQRSLSPKRELLSSESNESIASELDLEGEAERREKERVQSERLSTAEEDEYAVEQEQMNVSSPTAAKLLNTNTDTIDRVEEQEEEQDIEDETEQDQD